MATLAIKWSGKDYEVSITDSDTISDVKRKISELTEVPPKRQKLLGLKARGGKPAGDAAQVSDLVLKPGQRIMMMGQPDTHVDALNKQAEVAPHIQDDFDLGEDEMQEVALQDREENQAKLQRRIANVEVKLLNAPRPGKKCLVLDIDYTLFDLNSAAERPEELARPYLHEFLAAAYQHFDLVIWSATSMKWVEVKMQELGVLGHSDYRIAFMLDHKAMLTVHTEKYGVFDCKPLAFIWAKFSDHYTAENTIMFDDLRRNFVMNRQQGLTITPYKRAHTNRAKDVELFHLTRYLQLIGELPSLASLKHRRWRHYIQEHDRA